MDYPCTKFGDFGFSHFGIVVRTDTHTLRQTDRQTESRTHIITELQMRMITTLTRLSLASVMISAGKWMGRN